MKLLFTVGLLAATMSTALAQSYGNVPYGFSYNQGDRAKFIRVNAPGGAYVDCNPYNPNSPVRCTPDGW